MIYLAYMEDIPYKDIAKILNTNIGQVKTNIFRGKRKLREFLKKEGEDYV